MNRRRRHQAKRRRAEVPVGSIKKDPGLVIVPMKGGTVTLFLSADIHGETRIAANFVGMPLTDNSTCNLRKFPTKQQAVDCFRTLRHQRRLVPLLEGYLRLRTPQKGTVSGKATPRRTQIPTQG